MCAVKRTTLAEQIKRGTDRTTTPDGCWPWVRKAAANGYGQLNNHGKHYYAHRVAYELAKGPIPPGLQIDHLCRNPRCVRPDHLEAVTGSENVRRGMLARGKWDDAPISRSLTPGERRIVAAIAEGLSPKQVAGKLNISEQTIKNTLVSARRRVGARNTLVLALRFVRGDI